MKRILPYIKLLRPKHYLKNVLVFFPLVFAGQLTDKTTLLQVVWAFAAFCAVASAVYIINDVQDRHLDRLHPKKKFRPIASGAISMPAAVVMVIILLGIAVAIHVLAGFSWLSFALLLLYVLINIGYSMGLKNVPILDVAILSLGFVVRVFYGGEIADVEVSSWLYLAVLAASFYLGLGKRRNELMRNGATTRKVNAVYTQDFLDKNMYVCLGLTIVYYSLWAIDPAQKHDHMPFTIPLVILIAMAYSLTIESADSDGDPVNVIMKSRSLIALIAAYGLLMIMLVYVA